MNAGFLGAALRDSAIKQFGSTGVQSGEEFLDSLHGIHLTDNLPLQYLMGVDVVPLGRCFTIVGNFGSWKSAFGWYFASLFSKADGAVAFIDTEHKTNTEQVSSIYQDSRLNDVVTTKAKTLEHMLGLCVNFAKNYIANMPDEDIPLMLFVDSMGGVTSEDAVKGMIKTGNVDTGFTAAQNANKVTAQFKGFVPTYLDGHNMSLITVNHQKLKNDPNRPAHLPPATSEEGGRGKDFAYTYIFQLKPVKDMSTQAYSRSLVRIQTKKSSLSKVGYYIEVPITTYKAIPSQGIPMRTVFDWDYALVELLTREKKTFMQADLDAVCNLRRATEAKSSCTMLGVSPGSPMLPEDLGRLIHANPDMVEGIQDVLGISRKRVSFRCTPDPAPPGVVEEVPAEAEAEVSAEAEAPADAE